jgi:hypothetical protein
MVIEGRRAKAEGRRKEKINDSMSYAHSKAWE